MRIGNSFLALGRRGLRATRQTLSNAKKAQWNKLESKHGRLGSRTGLKALSTKTDSLISLEKIHGFNICATTFNDDDDGT